MEWSELYSAAVKPDFLQMTDYIGNPLWQELNSRIQAAYQVEPSIEYSSCPMQRGWNIKYRKGGKALCTLYPMSGYFIALVVIGEKEMLQAELLIPMCSEYMRELFGRTSSFHGQKWLMPEVHDGATANDIMNLIALRRKPQNTQEV